MPSWKQNGSKGNNNWQLFFLSRGFRFRRRLKSCLNCWFRLWARELHPTERLPLVYWLNWWVWLFCFWTRRALRRTENNWRSCFGAEHSVSMPTSRIDYELRWIPHNSADTQNACSISPALPRLCFIHIFISLFHFYLCWKRKRKITRVYSSDNSRFFGGGERKRNNNRKEREREKFCSLFLGLFFVVTVASQLWKLMKKVCRTAFKNGNCWRHNQIGSFLVLILATSRSCD